MPKDGNELDNMADLYKQMLEGAVIDVIPSPSPPRPRALSAPQDDDDRATVEELHRLWAEEDAQQQSTKPSNDGMVEQRPQPRAQPRERIRRPRRM